MMVFGPRRLPEIAARVGKMVRDLRSMSQGLMTEWQRELSVATRLEELEAARRDIEDVKQELQQARRSITSETSAELKHVRQEINQVKKEVEQSVEPAAAALSSTIEESTKDIDTKPADVSVSDKAAPETNVAAEPATVQEAPAEIKPAPRPKLAKKSALAQTTSKNQPSKKDNGATASDPGVETSTQTKEGSSGPATPQLKAQDGQGAAAGSSAEPTVKPKPASKAKVADEPVAKTDAVAAKSKQKATNNAGSASAKTASPAVPPAEVVNE